MIVENLLTLNRPYVANLLPCIVKIAKRSDDPIQESLGILMSKVVPILGPFMTEADIKVLFAMLILFFCARSCLLFLPDISLILTLINLIN